MKQKYFFNLLLVFFLFQFPAVFAQEETPEPVVRMEIPIEDLSIYPNPATGQRIYITTKNELIKQIEIFNVLGKPVLSARLTGNELNISSLEPGIYILKILEGKSTATRKLVVR